MSHYTMLSKYGNCTLLLEIKDKLKSVVSTNKVGKNSWYFVGVFKKIIPPRLVEYEMIIANSYPTRTRMLNGRPSFQKFPSFGVNLADIEQDTAIKNLKICQEMYGFSREYMPDKLPDKLQT